jgi:hypothetical protein
MESHSSNDACDLCFHTCGHATTGRVSGRLHCTADTAGCSEPSANQVSILEGQAALRFERLACRLGVVQATPVPGDRGGQFEPGGAIRYAFQLITTPGSSDFRLVVVNRGPGSAITSKVIASTEPEGGGWPKEDWFIRSAKLDWYLPQLTQKPGVKEGILIFGAGHGVIYWESGHYRNEFTDEVDRDQ